MTKLNLMMKACGVFLLWAAAAIVLPAQTFSTLLSFNGVNGASPEAGLTQATDGNLYGTTTNGGSSSYCIGACGTVFKITPAGMLTTLYSFCSLGGGNCTDGEEPFAGLVQATNGDFYGTTNAGGANFLGTVFSITPSGTLTTLDSFEGTDGGFPAAALVQATNGSLYGTTTSYGEGDYGTIFKITPNGMLTTLLYFDYTTGSVPAGGLVQGTDGNLYGTTYDGGGRFDGGTVFKITPSGTLTSLYRFDGADGNSPAAALIQGTDGNFYGTTDYGGASDACVEGCGTVFIITPSGKLTTLYSFCSKTNCADGIYPAGGLVQGTDGNFYGITAAGGANTDSACTYQIGVPGGCGTIFQITPSGTLSTLYNFCSQSNCTDGFEPYAALIQATNGEFYGTTEEGGVNGDGTVFSLNVGLGQFVETLPTSGKVGAHVKILGSFLTGATGVTFNGTAATFTIISKSEILTTVPTGATTGTVQVISPRLGTLSSNVPFIVRP